MRAVYLKDKTGNKVVTVPYYRIGDLFLTTIAENPSSYLGGTWELFGPGRTLVCVDTSQTEFNLVKKIGGSKYLQSHYHSVSIYTDYQGGHYHDGIYWGGWTPFTYTGFGGSDETFDLAGSGVYRQNYNYGGTTHLTTGSVGNHRHLISGNTGSNGAGNSGNLQPFITCYIWIRTA